MNPSRAIRDIAAEMFRKCDQSARYRREAPIYSSNYRCHASLICAIYCRDINEISQEQSAIFNDYRLHYFCTIL